MHTQTIARIKFAVIAIALMPTSHLAAGETVVDDSGGFTLTLPDGFAANPDLVGAAPDIMHGFVLGDPTDEELDIFLFIEKMGGTIGRERLKPEQMPPGSQARLVTTQWQGFEVDVFEIPEQLGEVQTLTYNVQIPLKRAAIQLKLIGSADRESELKSLLAEILDGLDGESNWIPSAAPAVPATPAENYGVVLLGCAIVFVLGGLVVLWLISRSAPKGTVLAIAAVIYCLGLGLASVRVREVMMLAGALKMLGFSGGLLGLVDLVRNRKPQTEDAE